MIDWLDVAVFDRELGDMPDNPHRPTTATDPVVQEITTMAKKTKTASDLPDHPAINGRVADRDEVREHDLPEALAEKLDGEIAEVAECVVARDNARREAADAQQRLQQASEHSRACVAREAAGTIDADEARKLWDARVVAVSACRYLEREHKTKSAALAGAVAALERIGQDRNRTAASQLTQSLAEGLRRNTDPEVLEQHARDQGATAEPGVTIWWPFFERRVLAEAKSGASKKPKHPWEREPNKDLPGDLERLFAIRRNALQARRQRLAHAARQAADEAAKAAAAAGAGAL